MHFAIIASAALLAAAGAFAFGRAVVGRGRPPAPVDPLAATDHAEDRVVRPPPSSNDNLGRLYEVVERELQARGYLR